MTGPLPGPPGEEPRATRVGVVVVTFDSERDIGPCLESLRQGAFRGIEFQVFLVDNASSDGTVALVRERFPEVVLLQNARNEGFAAANNRGIALALERGAEFVFLLNPDTTVDPDFLSEALAVARADPALGAVQSLLLLDPDRDRVNTWGNAVHFLGFGHCGGYRAPASAAASAPREIASASGAAVLVRARALQEAGLFDGELFLYQEDMDLSWRLRLAGWRLALAPRSVVYHRYVFAKSAAKFYFLERNRLVVMAKNLALRNLAVLAPLLLAAELGVLVLAARQGWAREKLRASAYFLRPRAWAQIARGRRLQRRIRRVSDREIARLFAASVEFDGVASPAVTKLINPASRLAWRVVSRLVR